MTACSIQIRNPRTARGWASGAPSRILSGFPTASAMYRDAQRQLSEREARTIWDVEHRCMTAGCNSHHGVCGNQPSRGVFRISSLLVVARVHAVYQCRWYTARRTLSHKPGRHLHLALLRLWTDLIYVKGKQRLPTTLKAQTSTCLLERCCIF